MDSNLVVKSESWLDLSHEVVKPIGGDQRQQTREKRHSISGYCPLESSNSNNLYDEAQTGELRKAPLLRSQQHLLIRLRQQSYLNKSSNSLTSNLSTSIDLNPSLLGRKQEFCEEDGSNKLLQKPLLRAESKRLKFFKDKLARSGKQQQVAHNQHDSSSPITRSLSSLSAKLSCKFDHICHSWKHFLYNYSQNHKESQWSISEGQLEADQLRFGAINLEDLNKRQLTNEWISRHYADADQQKKHSREQLRNEARAKSVEISSYLVKSRQQEQRDELQDARIQKQLNSSRDSSSSTTLVSALDDNKRSLESLDSSSTLNSAQMSAGKKRIAAQQPTSDYWSTVTTSSDYRKQQQIMSSPLSVSAQHEPMVMSQDQDYYLDVASASEQQQQQQQQVENSTRLIQFELSQPAEIQDDDYDDYAVPSDDSYRLDRSQVELVQMIGEGQKGYVFLGKLQSRDGQQITDVAIKTLKYETDQLIEKLMREAAMMRQFEHPHIIKFIGVCPETPALIAMELAKFGEIKQYLKLNRQLICPSQLILFTFQISTALSYLESKQYVHRDVAARNVLVCRHNCVKLADFGLSRNLLKPSESFVQQQHCQANKLLAGAQPELLIDADDKNHYVAASRGKLPVRWLAPESLAFRRFTSASDVWMFAVCSWELFHFGQVRPWSSIRNNQVLMAIESGQRLARPPMCPQRLYQLMLQCWSYAPIQRPKFRELKQSLWSIYLNEKAREQLEMEQKQQQRMLVLQRQHQDRLALLMNNKLHINQFQQQRTTPTQLNQELSEHPSSRLSSSPLMANYASGGYSSATTATGEHSNNSSRSSSMGSLARNQKTNSAWKQAKPANEIFLPLVPERNPLMQQQQVAGARQAELAQLDELRKQRLVEANIERFRRAPGHLLQKQRSQGSIEFKANYQADDLRSQKFGFDDQALRRKRVLTSGFALHEDADDDLSEPAEESKPQLWTAAPNLRFIEPAYEGLNGHTKGEIAMIKAELSPTSSNLTQAARANAMLVQPINRLHLSAQTARKEEHEQKLSNMLQALKVAPVKAKLSYSRQSSAEPSAREEGAQKAQEEQRQLALHQRLLGNIRQPASASNLQRRSVNLEQRASNQTSGSTQVEAVDQSLQLLESLIAGDQTNKSQQKNNQSMRRHKTTRLETHQTNGARS